MEHKVIRSAVSAIALLAAVARFVWPTAPIDGVLATLLVLAVVPWLQPLFKSLELPGGVKIEFQDLKDVTKRADAAGLLAEPGPTAERPRYSFQQVASSDPNLALAGLRIELERRLDQLARSRGYEGTPQGIGNLLRHLNSRELIGAAERSVLTDLVALLNAAVHGAQVTPEAAEWALEIGPRILVALEQRSASSTVRYEGIVPDR